MWMIIHMVRSLSKAEAARRCLSQEGFLVRTNAVDCGAGGPEAYYELMVPESEAAEARQALIDHGLF